MKLHGEKHLFAKSEPNQEGFLPVADGHKLHYAQFGNPNGKPIVILHGGPGSGWNTNMPRYFNPKEWNITCFSQRGAGQSTPNALTEAGLAGNTTQNLVADIECLRQHLGITKWSVYGHSWGSTLSLAYAQSHPASVNGVMVSGIFYMRHQDMLFHYQGGAATIFPEGWQKFCLIIPKEEQGDMIRAYNKQLFHEDKNTVLNAALHWNRWDFTCSNVQTMSEEFFRTTYNDEWQIKHARIENHFFLNSNFMKDGQLIENVKNLQDIKIEIVHGRFDIIAPAVGAHLLKQACDSANVSANLNIIAGACHNILESEDYTKQIMDAATRLP